MAVQFEVYRTASDKWYFQLVVGGSRIRSRAYNTQSAALSAVEKFRQRVVAAEVFVPATAGTAGLRASAPIPAGSTVTPAPPDKASHIRTSRRRKAAARAIAKSTATKASPKATAKATAKKTTAKK